MDRTELQVSVVIPVYNEEGAISDDLDIIIATMEGSGYTYEVIVVDDGSTDRTADIARAKGVKVSSPFGRKVARVVEIACFSPR